MGAFFKNYMAENDYSNIYLVNVKTGKLKDSALGEVWRKTMERMKPTFVDMKPYSIDNNQPKMFLGAPVIEDEEMTAVLVFKFSDKHINEVMKFRKGYKKKKED